MQANLRAAPSGRKSNPPPHAPVRSTSAIRVLGLCGLLSAIFSAAAGFLELPLLLGVAGATMVVGNLFAIFGDRRDRQGSR